MSFKRIESQSRYITGDELTGALIGIGIRLHGATIIQNVNIEDTLLSATHEGMNGDYRVLSLLIDWIEVHHSSINVDRLYRALKTNKHEKLSQIFWVAISKWLRKDLRFRNISKLYKGPKLDLFGEKTEFMISRKGEDERFKGTCLRIPNESLRKRLDDILLPEQLAKIHLHYFHRVLIGPTYRADQIALLKEHHDLSPSELARKSYSSFKTAWDTKKDWQILECA